MLTAEPRYRVGQRVELRSMPEDPDPIAVGTQGVVESSTVVNLGPAGELRFEQVSVAWDNGRRIMACVPPDRLAVVDQEEGATE